jgi:hypothetical protein
MVPKVGFVLSNDEDAPKMVTGYAMCDFCRKLEESTSKSEAGVVRLTETRKMLL